LGGQVTGIAASSALGGEYAQGVNFVVTGKGVAVPIPSGATGPQNVVNPQGNVTGHFYSGGQGGANGQVNTVRIMQPVPARGRAPAYPDGYVVYENGRGPRAQAVDPRTGQTVPPSRAHHSLTP
jgi:hypothetical protein